MFRILLYQQEWRRELAHVELFIARVFDDNKKLGGDDEYHEIVNVRATWSRLLIIAWCSTKQVDVISISWENPKISNDEADGRKIHVDYRRNRKRNQISKQW
jgi:hypothetical protein